MDIPAPVLTVGDRLKVWLPVDNEETTTKRKAKITTIKRCKKIKHESWYQYTLQFDDGEEQITRLLHLKYKVSKKSKKRPPEDDDEEASAKKQRSSRLPSHQRILAPMVGGSELAFRLLCRRYGCDLAYTPMINSQVYNLLLPPPLVLSIHLHSLPSHSPSFIFSLSLIYLLTLPSSAVCHRPRVPQGRVPNGARGPASCSPFLCQQPRGTSHITSREAACSGYSPKKTRLKFPGQFGVFDMTPTHLCASLSPNLSHIAMSPPCAAVISPLLFSFVCFCFPTCIHLLILSTITLA